MMMAVVYVVVFTYMFMTMQVIEGLTAEKRSYWERLWMCSDRRSGPQHPLIYRLAVMMVVVVMLFPSWHDHHHHPDPQPP